MSNRNYCFTINNYTDKDLHDAKTLTYKYILIGKEKGESGTEHLQGYVQLKNPIRFSTLKNLLPRAHIEIAKGTPQQNIDYCKKEGVFEEFGDPKHQGYRSDLQELSEDLVDGLPIEEIAFKHPTLLIKYSKGIDRFLAIRDRPSMRNTTVMWLWGRTGVGKTRWLFDQGLDVYIKDNTQWWDGYNNQYDVVLIDDFDGKWPFRDLLRLLDRYPYKGQIKGGYVNINCDSIVITCDRSPNKLFEFLPDHELGQLLRRINSVAELTK